MIANTFTEFLVDGVGIDVAIGTANFRLSSLQIDIQGMTEETIQ